LEYVCKGGKLLIKVFFLKEVSGLGILGYWREFDENLGVSVVV